MLCTYHGAAVVHVVGVLVGVGTEIDARRDTGEGPAVLAAQPAVGAHVLVFHLKGEHTTATGHSSVPLQPHSHQQLCDRIKAARQAQGFPFSYGTSMAGHQQDNQVSHNPNVLDSKNILFTVFSLSIFHI